MAVNPKNGASSNNDSFDINELAYLDEDITPEFIEKLQMDVMKTAQDFGGGNSGKLDVNMFEEVRPVPQTPQSDVSDIQNETVDIKDENITSEESVEEDATAINNLTQTDVVEKQMDESGINTENEESKEHTINQKIDDNFIKKYKAKLNKQPQEDNNDEFTLPDRSVAGQVSQTADGDSSQSIENLTQGNITEKEITQEQQDYNEALDLADDNIKYSKYIIYINPENTEFMESLTVKERKNLINKILSEQGNIILSKKKTDFVKSVFQNVFIALITIAIMIPIVYKAINFSLESTIDNYRRSQSNFQTLYKEHGKIKPRP